MWGTIASSHFDIARPCTGICNPFYIASLTLLLSSSQPLRSQHTGHGALGQKALSLRWSSGAIQCQLQWMQHRVLRSHQDSIQSHRCLTEKNRPMPSTLVMSAGKSLSPMQHAPTMRVLLCSIAQRPEANHSSAPTALSHRKLCLLACVCLVALPYA